MPRPHALIHCFSQSRLRSLLFAACTSKDTGVPSPRPLRGRGHDARSSHRWAMPLRRSFRRTSAKRPASFGYRIRCSTTSPRSTPDLTSRSATRDSLRVSRKKWTWAPDSLSIAFPIDPARALARCGQAGHGQRRSLHASRLFTDPKVASPNAARAHQSRFGFRSRFAHRSRLVQEAHTRTVLRRGVPVGDHAPEHVYGRHSIRRTAAHVGACAKRPIGSGRFRFVKWEPGTVRIELVADTTQLSRGRAKLDRIAHRCPGRSADRAPTQVLTGQADFHGELVPVPDQRCRRSTKQRRGSPG